MKLKNDFKEEIKVAKKFSEKLNEIIKDTTSKTKDGKMKKVFSRKFYNEVANALVNDPDYEFESVQMKGGKPEPVVSKPSKAFREKLLKPIVGEFIDSADAEKYINEYQFTRSQTDALYDLGMAINIEMMRSGKTLRFPSQKDFIASIEMRELPESVYTNRQNGAKTKKKACMQLIKHSTTPPWLKEKLK